MKTLVLSCCCLLLFTGAGGVRPGEYDGAGGVRPGQYDDPWFTGDEEAEVSAILPYITAHLDQLSDIFGQHVTTSERLDSDVTSGVPSAACLGCMAFVDLLSSLITGKTPTEIEDGFMDLCYFVILNATNDFGNKPELLCPGIRDTYLWPVAYILNTTDKTSQDICVFWNECLYHDFDPPLSANDTLVCFPAQLPAASTESRDDMTTGPPDLTNAIRVMHITDIHLEEWYDVGSATDCGMPTCCRNEWNQNGNGFAGFWGEAECNQPVQLTDVMLSFAASLDPRYVLYSGDTPPNTPWTDSVPGHKNASTTLTSSFATNLPGVPVYACLGNHDLSPTNMFWHNSQEAMDSVADFSELWGPLANFGQEQTDTFLTAAYYSSLLEPGLRVLTYNSNFGTLDNLYNLLGDHPGYDSMKVFMESTLASASLSGEKVIMIGHHPPGQSQYLNEYTCFMTELQARYRDTIVLHVHGHKHADLFRLYRDLETGETVGTGFSSPAGTTRSTRNPSFRIFYLDPTTYQLLDADTYRVYIESHYGAPDGSVVPVVEFAYRFTEEYNMTDLSPLSMQDFVVRMETDDLLWNTFLWNEATASPSKADFGRDEQWRMEELCQMKNTAYPGYLSCTGEL